MNHAISPNDSAPRGALTTVANPKRVRLTDGLPPVLPSKAGTTSEAA